MSERLNYKGFTVCRIPKTDNGGKPWRIFNKAGLIKSVSSLREAKGWIDHNPADNYSVCPRNSTWHRISSATAI